MRRRGFASFPQNGSLARNSPARHGSREMQTYEGGCHCGRVRFHIRRSTWRIDRGRSNCSICTKKGILHLPVTPRAAANLLQRPRRSRDLPVRTGMAQHTFCRHCGIHAFYVPRSRPGKLQRQRPLPRRLRSGADASAPPFRRPALGGRFCPRH